MNFQVTTPASLPPGGRVPLTISEEAGWAQGPFWIGYRRKVLLPLPANEPKFLGRPAHSPFTILTTASYGGTYLNFRVEGKVAPR